MRMIGGSIISILQQRQRELMAPLALATYSLLKCHICKKKRLGRSTVAAQLIPTTTVTAMAVETMEVPVCSTPLILVHTLVVTRMNICHSEVMIELSGSKDEEALEG
ncbi:hypothetical protein SEVIR_4G023301v4 [Setaria viridis]